MKAPVHNSRGRATFGGRIARAPFNAWADSLEGRAVLAQIASGMRFTLLGRMRTARRRVWRQLNDAVLTDAAAAALQREMDEYLQRIDPIVYAQELPRVSLDLRRLIAVPRVFVNAEAYRGVYTVLQDQPAFAAFDGGDSLREWFVLAAVDEMQRAANGARPSSRHPLPVGTDWIIIGVNEAFEWRVPFDGTPWPGHYYALELTSSPVTRAVRKAADEAVANLERSLPSLSRARRSEILRQSSQSLESLLAPGRGRAVSF